MREITLAFFVIFVMSVEAYSQTASATLSIPSIVRVTPLLVAAPVTPQGALMRPRPIHRCCHLKGALIGGAIGAAVGFAYSRLCDAGDCTLTTIKYMAVTGGIGAGLGAFAQRQSPGLPWPSVQ